jgi:hypothetical protein
VYTAHVWFGLVCCVGLYGDDSAVEGLSADNYDETREEEEEEEGDKQRLHLMFPTCAVLHHTT